MADSRRDLHGEQKRNRRDHPDLPTGKYARPVRYERGAVVLDNDDLLDIFSRIDDKEDLYSALLAHKQVAMVHGNIYRGPDMGVQWDRVVAANAPQSSSSSSSLSSPSSPTEDDLVPIRRGQIVPAFADMYYKLVVRDIMHLREGSDDYYDVPYTFTQFGRDIWVRLCGEATLALLLADPDVSAKITTHAWEVDLLNFAKRYIPTRFNYPRQWNEIVARMCRSYLQSHGFARSMNSRDGRIDVFRTLAYNDEKSIPYLIFLFHLDGGGVDMVHRIQEDSHHMVRSLKVWHSNSAGDRIQAPWSLDAAAVMADLMLQHNEYIAAHMTGQGQTPFPIIYIASAVSDVYQEGNGVSYGDGYVNYSQELHLSWEKMYALLFSDSTRLYDRMMRCGETTYDSSTNASLRRFIAGYTTPAMFQPFCAPMFHKSMVLMADKPAYVQEMAEHISVALSLDKKPRPPQENEDPHGVYDAIVAAQNYARTRRSGR